ncbi:MAG: FecR family protein [Candidatus Cloacimonetes bacterium]|nr:FecR family protein [Candidatus Cloacimonadota bacterium]
MKKLILITILVIVALSLAAQSPVAYLSAVKGKVNLTRANKNLTAKRGEMLVNSDQLKTGSESFAAYKFVDGTTNIKVFANSTVQIKATSEAGKMSKTVSIAKGSVLTKVSGGSFQVETPTTVASVKGTGFLTKVDEKGETMIIVTEGTVQVESKETGESQDVESGNTANVGTDGKINVEETSEEDMTDLEEEEAGADAEGTENTMKIQVTDENGNIKYIEIRY